MPNRTRPLELDDAAELAARLASARAFMAPYEPIRPDAFYTAEGQREVLRVRLERGALGLEVPLAVLDDDGRIAGGVTLQAIELGAYRSCGIGYWVAPDGNGHGWATQAVGEALGVAFGDLGLHRVQAAVLPDNARSLRVLAKHGFGRIGLAPRYLHLAGAWRDHLLLQRLVDDARPVG